MDTEWIKHDGAIQPECPVDPECMVDFKRVMDTEPDSIWRGGKYRAGDIRWNWVGKSSDVIAYRIIEEETK